MPPVFTTARFIFPNYFAFIFLCPCLWQLVSLLTSITSFPPSLKSSSLWRLVAKPCPHLEHSDADRLSPKIRISKFWTPHYSTFLTLLSAHISFNLLFTSTLLLSNASLRSCLGKIPNRSSAVRVNECTNTLNLYRILSIHGIGWIPPYTENAPGFRRWLSRTLRLCLWNSLLLSSLPLSGTWGHPWPGAILCWAPSLRWLVLASITCVSSRWFSALFPLLLPPP